MPFFGVFFLLCGFVDCFFVVWLVFWLFVFFFQQCKQQYVILLQFEFKMTWNYVV